MGWSESLPWELLRSPGVTSSDVSPQLFQGRRLGTGSGTLRSSRGCLERWAGEKGSAGGLEGKWELRCGCQQLILILSSLLRETLAVLALESSGQREVWAAQDVPRVRTGGSSTNLCPGQGANARGR